MKPLMRFNFRKPLPQVRRIPHRTLWHVLALSGIAFTACDKEDDTQPLEPPITISSMCLGEWRSDSSYNISSSQYQNHPQGTFTFRDDGRLNIAWPDGSVDDLTFYVGEEATNIGQSEIGRSLIWVQDPDGAQYWGGILMIYQTPTECNLLFSDDIAPIGPEHTLGTVHEYLWVDNDPVFDFWSKCYKQ